MSANSAQSQVDPVRLAFVNFMRENRGLPPLKVKKPRPVADAYREERAQEAAAMARLEAKREREAKKRQELREAELHDAYIANLMKDLERSP